MSLLIVPQTFTRLLSTPSVIAVVCVILPSAAMTVSADIESTAVGWVVIVSAVLAVGISGLAPNCARMPAGRPLTLKFTPLAYPATEVNWMV